MAFCHPDRSEKVYINHSKSMVYKDSFAAIRMIKAIFLAQLLTSTLAL
jgi:hypothetical protein